MIRQQNRWQFVRGSLAPALLVLVLAVVLGPIALAAPLPKSECEQLMVEQQALEALGVANDLAKGPEIVRATAVPARIEEIRRYLHVFEQLAFRCTGRVTAAKIGQPTVDGVALPERKPAGRSSQQSGVLRPAIDPLSNPAIGQRSDATANSLQALSVSAPVSRTREPEPAAKPKKTVKTAAPADPKIPSLARSDHNAALPNIFQSLR